jgi:hypothetical protein
MPRRSEFDLNPAETSSDMSDFRRAAKLLFKVILL